jgi:hypothetical protein
MFFDGLGLKWNWEPQGFLCTDGTPYLPDFAVYAALGTLWVEVKTDWESDPDGVGKWQKFSASRPQPSRAILLAGQPSADLLITIIGGDQDAEKPVRGPWEDDCYTWRPCPSGHHFDVAYPGQFRAKFAEDGCEQLFGGNGEQRIIDAANAARSARFGTHEAPGAGAGTAA